MRTIASRMFGLFCATNAGMVTGLTAQHVMGDEAPPVAAGLHKLKPVTTGATEVTSSTYEGHQATGDEEAKDTTAAKISAGALMTSGNSSSVATTASGNFRLRRGMNQLTLVAAANYATARPKGETGMQKTVENYQAKSRYDRFVAEHFALFGAVSVRKDRFQGLDWRFNVDPGIAYYFVDEKDSQFWSELGYDYQYDIRSETALTAANAEIGASGEALSRTQSRHSGRLFLGYVGSINSNVGLNLGTEYLQALAETENWRLVVDAGIQASLAERFAVSTTLSMRYDHNPLPGIKELDTIEAVSLVYTLL